jgi:hypothetical protein
MAGIAAHHCCLCLGNFGRRLSPFAHRVELPSGQYRIEAHAVKVVHAWPVPQLLEFQAVGTREFDRHAVDQRMRNNDEMVHAISVAGAAALSPLITIVGR